MTGCSESCFWHNNEMIHILPRGNCCGFTKEVLHRPYERCEKYLRWADVIGAAWDVTVAKLQEGK
jgi:hypothetical protein